MARRRDYKMGPCSRCRNVVLKKGAYCRKCKNLLTVENFKKRSTTKQFCMGCRHWFFPLNSACAAHQYRDTHGPMRKPLNWYCSVPCMLKAKTKHGPQTEKERLRKRRYRERQKQKKELGACQGRCPAKGDLSPLLTPVLETRTVQVPRS